MEIKHENESSVNTVLLMYCEPGSCVKYENQYYLVALGFQGNSKIGINLVAGGWISSVLQVEPVEAHVVVES